MNRYLASSMVSVFEMLLDLVKRIEKLLKWSFKLRIMDLKDFNTLHPMSVNPFECHAAHVGFPRGTSNQS